MNNPEFIDYIKLWFPELNSAQIDRLRTLIKEAEVGARIEGVKLLSARLDAAHLKKADELLTQLEAKLTKLGANNV